MSKEMWLIWKNPSTRRRYKIGSLKFDNNYTFTYINPELDDAKISGFDYFPGFEDINKTYTSNRLFANIETRLPNPSRPDYLEILNLYGLDAESSALEILEATKGRLITDNYEFVPSFNTNKIDFDIAGTKHCKDVEKCKKYLTINDKLELELDSSNQYDNNAIKIICNKNGRKYHIGYVPRYYAKELTEVLKKNVNYSAMIMSLNFNKKLFHDDITASVKLIFK